MQRLIKRLLKLVAKHILYYRLRIILFRWCGYIIGKNVYIGEDLIVIDDLEDKYNIILKDHVTIAPRVTMITRSYPNASLIKKNVPTMSGPIIIEKNAWVGTGVIILPNITIGEGTLIGAGSVVTKNVPPYTIVGGVPAKPIGKIMPDKISRSDRINLKNSLLSHGASPVPSE